LYIDSEKPLLGMINYIINQSILCGTNIPRIQEKPLQAETLDLSRAINIARGIEISTHQLKDLSEESDKAVHAMNESWRKSSKDKVQYKTIKDSEVGKNGNLEDV
jgi:uncharacterized protein with von Willebrand factor type A (vWA) domain